MKVPTIHTLNPAELLKKEFQKNSFRILKRIAMALLFFILFLIAWHSLSASGYFSSILIPSPIKVGQYLTHAVADGSLLHAAIITIKRLVIGYAIGLLIGIPLGLLTARFCFLRDTIGLLALGLQALPSVCWVPIALLGFGQTEATMLFVVVMGTLWSILVATESGVLHVPRIYIRAARTMGSQGIHTWIKVIFPASLPFIVGGMKQGWGYAWRSLMAAEIYITILSGFGLGHLLHYGRELHAMDQVLGIMIVIILIGLSADKILFLPWENFLRKRWGTGLH